MHFLSHSFASRNSIEIRVEKKNNENYYSDDDGADDRRGRKMIITMNLISFESIKKYFWSWTEFVSRRLMIYFQSFFFAWKDFLEFKILLILLHGKTWEICTHNMFSLTSRLLHSQLLLPTLWARWYFDT